MVLMKYVCCNEDQSEISTLHAMHALRTLSGALASINVQISPDYAFRCPIPALSGLANHLTFKPSWLTNAEPNRALCGLSVGSCGTYGRSRRSVCTSGAPFAPSMCHAMW